MNPRNTFLPQKPNTKTNNQQSGNIDRGTFNPYNSISKTQRADKAEIQNKLIGRIIGFVHKLQKLNETRIISRQMLRTGSNKIFLDVVCIFIKTIDPKFERGDVNAEVVMQLLKAFGYPHTYSKSIFQPIGAPHTWGHCLMILQWFGQLADFTHNFEVEQQDESFKSIQKNMLMLNSFNDRNSEPITSYIIQQSNNLSTQIQNLNFSIDSKKMAIANHQNAQKDIFSLEKQIQKQKQLVYRIKQQIFQFQSQQRICDELIDNVSSQISQNKERLKQFTTLLQNIEYEIDHQELLPEQCERLKLQTLQIKNRILRTKQQTVERRNRFKVQSSEFLQKLVNKVTFINELNAQMRTNRLLQNHGLQIPNIKISQLSNLLMLIEPKKDSKPDKQIQIIHEFMRTDEYFEYLQRQSNLIAMFDRQIKDLKQKLKNQQQSNSQLSMEHQKQKSKWRQLQRALKAIQNRRTQKQKQVLSLQHEIERMGKDQLAMQSELSNMIAYKKRIMQETRMKVNEIKKLHNETVGMQKQFQEIIARSQAHLQRHEEQCLSKINTHIEFMKKMNEEESQKYIQANTQPYQSNTNAP